MDDHESIIRPLRRADLAAAVAVTESVGWGDRHLQWDHFLDWAGEGALGMFIHGSLVSAGCAFCYGAELAWLGFIATRHDQQRRGYGTRLCEALIAYAQSQGIQRIMLDAGASGEPLYATLGFRAHSHLGRWRGVGQAFAAPGTDKPGPGDLARVIALDARQFGVPRGRIIRDLVTDRAVKCWVLRREGDVQGFIALKAWIPGGADHIGPWHAGRPEDAQALLSAALSAHQGRPLYLDIPAGNADAREIAERCGLQQTGGATRMIFGRAKVPPKFGELQFGIAMRATG
jgi:GNAT superfamily N-acetyltransferase